jgi:DNA-directed RNA polymerase specialized sigma24 family protein
MAAGRPNRLADPEFAKAVAELYAAGLSHSDMAEELNCAKETVPRWIRDPRVQAHSNRLIQERVGRITRRIDSAIEGRLAYIDKFDLDDLLKVRKEFIRSLPQGVAADTVGATTELAEAMDQNPELAKALQALAKGEGLSAKPKE